MADIPSFCGRKGVVMPRCPNCQAEINELLFWSKGSIEFGGNIKRDGWYPMQDVERNYQCPECYIPLDADDLDKLGVSEEMR